MLTSARVMWAVSRRYRDYRPQPVNLAAYRRWLAQFDPDLRGPIAELLTQVRYLSEAEVRRALVRQNAALLAKLQRSGVDIDHVVYVQVDDAGSSSPVTLNLLRDSARLDRSGAMFCDSRDVQRIHKLTAGLESGAVVYVDDFVGTGSQICRSRDFVASYIVGNFSEFVLAPVICEEALYEFAARGILGYSDHLHSKAERPLHENGKTFSVPVRDRLRDLCRQMEPKWGLGYHELATAVVLYRNCPNTTPMILRGSYGQTPLVGIFPRVTDLPAVAP